MKNTIFMLLFLFLGSNLIAQNQQGWLTIIDKTPDGLVYYISPIFDCKFPGDHDGIDAQRIAFDKQFKEFVLKKHQLVAFQSQDNNWMEPGRGIFPAKSYSKYLEFFPQTHPDAKLVMVPEFKLVCDI